MIGKAGLCAVQCAVNGFQRKVVIRYAFLILHGDIGHRMLQFCFHLQKQPPGFGGFRPDVGMRKRIQNRAVHMNHKHPKKFFCLRFLHRINKRLQKLIQLPHINRIICDTWHMFVKNQQAVQCFIQIGRCRKLQELTALFHKLCIIRCDITGAHRCMPLRKVTDTLGINICMQKFIKPLRKIQYLHQRIRLIGQIRQFLFVGQYRTLDDLQNLRSCLIHPFHGNVSHMHPPVQHTASVPPMLFLFTFYSSCQVMLILYHIFTDLQRTNGTSSVKFCSCESCLHPPVFFPPGYKNTGFFTHLIRTFFPSVHIRMAPQSFVAQIRLSASLSLSSVSAPGCP